VDWLRGVIGDLAAGRLTWDEQWLREIYETFHSEQAKEGGT
jgi:hypothetical protein